MVTRRGRRRSAAFTLIELLIVMAIMATLLSIALPRYLEGLERAKEVALRSDLRVVREAIDKHRGDTGRLPDSIQALVDARYLRSVPMDPIAETTSGWIIVPHPDGATPGVWDVRSSAAGASRDGTEFASW
jgi:prepilin-type N-terminal cleavage/methylation domain-containing protein